MQLQNRSGKEFLVAWHDAESRLVMHFMVNTAFVNYLDKLIDSLKFCILLIRATHEHTVPVSLQSLNLILTY